MLERRYIARDRPRTTARQFQIPDGVRRHTAPGARHCQRRWSSGRAIRVRVPGQDQNLGGGAEDVETLARDPSRGSRQRAANRCGRGMLMRELGTERQAEGPNGKNRQ